MKQAQPLERAKRFELVKAYQRALKMKRFHTALLVCTVSLSFGRIYPHQVQGFNGSAAENSMQRTMAFFDKKSEEMTRPTAKT